MKNKRGGIQFGWMFAVIVGAVILFLAFYFIGQLMTEERIERGTVATRTLDVVITPLSFFGELGATTAYLIELPTASRIDIKCEPIGNLGYNSILLLAKGETKYEAGYAKKIYDKYLFGENLDETEEKRFQSLTKSLYLPWRVADLTMLWPSDRQYCFVHNNWGRRGIMRIKKELGDEPTGFNISSISFVENECEDADAINVCFDRIGCDINVKGFSSKEGVGTVTKRGRGTVNYAGDTLMYAAIFSDPGLYECNLQRIARRLLREIQVYEVKNTKIEGGFDSILNTLKTDAYSVEINIEKNQNYQLNLNSLWQTSLTLKQINNYATRKLF